MAVNAAPPVHPVGKRHRVVVHLSEYFCRGPRDDTCGTDGNDLLITGEVREGFLDPFGIFS